VLATETNPNARSLPPTGCCSHSLPSAAAPDTGSREILPVANEIKLISWNIAKGRTEGWKEDLRELAADAQLVMLQEAILSEEMKQPRETPIHWSFSPGYRTNAYDSGVMTLSRVKPDLLHSLPVREPWLRSPKATHITRFHHGTGNDPLLVVNMHAINFTFGTRAYTDQLREIGEVLSAHQGPIIFSGDLNTWSQARSEVLHNLMDELGLTAVSFTPDHRVRRFGHALDYVFVRGLTVKESYTVDLDSSDHNPLVLTVVVQDA
jgi:endonuclease/exonuclease/phosphatase (EEP) superfamily protein YafD